MGIMKKLEDELWRYCKIGESEWKSHFRSQSPIYPPPIDRISISTDSVNFEIELNSFAGRRHLAFTHEPEKYFALQITIWPFWDSKQEVTKQMTIYTLIIDKKTKRVQDVVIDYPYREFLSIGRFFTDWFRNVFNFKYDVFKKLYLTVVQLNLKNI